MIRKILVLLTLLTISLLVGEGLYYFRKGFSPRRLHPFLVGAKEEKIAPEIQQILSQPFYFLGRGRQCFAFESKDGKYVLKFPRTDIYRIPLWARAFATEKYKEQLRAEKEKRRRFVFESFRIAMEQLPSETGTIAIYLGTNHSLNTSLHLVDKLKISHRFPLSSTFFILQRKSHLWTSLFLDAKNKSDTAEKTRLMHALLDVMIDRGKKQIFNRDRSFLRNYGFDGEKAYQIDVGDFYYIPALAPDFALQKSVRDSIQPVQEWLTKVDPSMLPIIQERLDAL